MRKNDFNVIFPDYLEKDINNYINAINKKDSLIDCYYCELRSSINIAEADGAITSDMANKLRQCYL